MEILEKLQIKNSNTLDGHQQFERRNIIRTSVLPGLRTEALASWTGRPPGGDSRVLDPRVGTLAAWGSGPALPGDQLLYYEDPKAIMRTPRLLWRKREKHLANLGTC